MPSNTAKPVSPRRTRSSNVNKHVGLPDLPAKKRRSAEKRVDEQRLADQHTAKAAKTKAAIEKMGRIKQKMETDQATAVAPVKPVCLRPCQKVRKIQGATNTEGSLPNASQPTKSMKTVAMQSTKPLSSMNTKWHDEDQAEHGGSSNADGVAEAKRSIKKKMPLCEAIDDGRTQQKMETVGKEQCLLTRGVSCKKPVISSTKNALAGRVKNWVVSVHKSTSDVQKALQSMNSVPKKAPLPASTSAATGSSKTLAVSNVEGPPPTESIGSTGRTVVSDKLDPTPGGPDDLTGGFGDDLDDDVEREATLLNKKQLVCCPFNRSRSLTMLDAQHRLHHPQPQGGYPD
ncbi:hypothetical protein JVT61DRAFT_10703 [Boletus reticuloceps]|uniref:Uncharacterized protein n=1 Tax=Boletus reticuloceps TaxID=495285 RepID=A0A8I3A447_9AGAM|nr:hypothetical protein JVT61DRAFT_12402 [Boletus reticuloceps]KAG6370988.1 hypothetical protein JVT61DRAFT_10703 [Boletus reticuloceps]